MSQPLSTEHLSSEHYVPVILGAAVSGETG